MTYRESLAKQLATALKYFKATASQFEEADSGFAPDPEMFTVAGQVAHVADTVDWFVEGAFGKGWDMDFEAMFGRIRAVPSLADANAWVERAFAAAVETVASATDEELHAPIPDERMMKGMPRGGIVNGIVDHTAHHRGSLAVYLRVMGRRPTMPYS